MGYDRYAVVKVAGAEPEVFWVIWFDSKMPATSFMETSQNLTEGEVRSELAKMGRAESEIDSLVRQAREDPK